MNQTLSFLARYHHQVILAGCLASVVGPLWISAQAGSLAQIGGCVVLVILALLTYRLQVNWPEPKYFLDRFVKEMTSNLLYGAFAVGVGLMMSGHHDKLIGLLVGWGFLAVGVVTLALTVRTLIRHIPVWASLAEDYQVLDLERKNGLQLSPVSLELHNLGSFTYTSLKTGISGTPKAPATADTATWEETCQNMTEAVVLDLYARGHMVLERRWVLRPWKPSVRTALYQAMQRGWLDSDTGQVTSKGSAVLHNVKVAAAEPEFVAVANLRASFLATLQEND